ncbi:hypothetical protein ACOMHN_054981 [Nucella lapillus]
MQLDVSNHEHKPFSEARSEKENQQDRLSETGHRMARMILHLEVQILNSEVQIFNSEVQIFNSEVQIFNAEVQILNSEVQILHSEVA